MHSGTKRDRAIAAGSDIFMRYGYARTTMGDIARAAGMSRPALYQLFPGKDEVYRAVVLHLNDIRMAEIRQQIAGLDRPFDRLCTACELWLVQVFELKATTPDARDMDDLAFPVVREVYATLQALLAELILQGGAQPSWCDAGTLARMLVFAIRGLGATAADVADMQRLTRLQVAMLCKSIDAWSAGNDGPAL